MMTPKAGELWKVRGIWSWENPVVVRIEEVYQSGNVDVNYEIDPTAAKDLRVLPAECLLNRIQEDDAN